MNDLLAQIAISLGSVTLATWALTDLLGKHLKAVVPKELIALVVGPLLSMGAYATGYLPAVTALVPTKPLAFLSAAFAGLISTVVAAKFHDWVSAPLARRFGSVDKPPAV